MSGAVGRAIAELDTPVVTVDLDRLERNLERVATYAAEHDLGLLPHAKTHKTREIARRQLELGARGLTVAKVGEAEVFAAAGEPAPLLLHYPVVGRGTVERLAAVAERTPVTVAVDSLAAAEPIAAALARRGVGAQALIELDVGLRRTGVAPAEAASLARGIEALGGGLRVAGLSCYPGHLRFDEDAIVPGLAEVDALVEEAAEGLRAAGIDCQRISGGSTATVLHAHLTRMTEVRPGNYALLDRAEARGPYALEDCALRVHASVVSTSVPGRVVVDAGSKTLSDAVAPPGLQGFAAAVGRDEIAFDALSEEHGHGALAAGAAPPAVGDRLELIPNHACTCVNLHDVLYGVRDGVVEAELRVVARGAVS